VDIIPLVDFFMILRRLIQFGGFTRRFGRCTEAAPVAEEESFNQLLEAETAGCDGGPEYEELHRRWAQLRQKNSRLMRKHNLKGKRERP